MLAYLGSRNRLFCRRKIYKGGRILPHAALDDGSASILFFGGRVGGLSLDLATTGSRRG